MLSFLVSLIAAPRTVVSIQGDAFYINGQPTYKGRTWQGHKIEGLLLNSRMVQGIFDDANPKPRNAGPIRIPASGMPSEIRANSWPPCLSGENMDCSP